MSRSGPAGSSENWTDPSWSSVLVVCGPRDSARRQSQLPELLTLRPGRQPALSEAL
jgi:hypothetical protein